MKFMPKTKLGKWSFWLTILGIAMIFIPYWIAMIFDVRVPIPSGFVAVMLVTIFGICSMISFFKKRDKCIALIISSILGLFGILMVLGELVFPH